VGDRRATARRGASETLGFLFVFAIIVSTIAVVYVSGYDSLTNARDYERVENAQRAFEVLRDNVEDITHRGAPSRATEVKLARAGIETADPVTIEIEVDGGAYSTGEIPIQPIRYDPEQQEQGDVVYSMGAIFRGSGENSAMVYEPNFVVRDGTDKRVVLPVVRTRAEGGNESISGSTTVLVRTFLVNQSALVRNRSSSTVDVTVRIQSPRAPAWQRYLDEEGMDCDSNPDDDVANCDANNVDYLTVSRTLIDVSIR
jgi:hypothetical protein